MVRAVRPTKFGGRGQRPIRSPDRPLRLEGLEEPLEGRSEPLIEPRDRVVDVAHRAADLVRELPMKREAEMPCAQAVRTVPGLLEEQQVLLHEASESEERIGHVQPNQLPRHPHPKTVRDTLESVRGTSAQPIGGKCEKLTARRFRPGLHVVNQVSTFAAEPPALPDLLLPSIVENEPVAKVERSDPDRELPGSVEKGERHRRHGAIERRGQDLSSAGAASRRRVRRTRCRRAGDRLERRGAGRSSAW